jgi:superfamily II DNA/RNA helicase
MGRGMDFEGVTLVLQVGYASPDVYMQRAGRTGRGLVATGRSTILLAEQERETVELIAKARGVEFKEVRAVPDRTPSVSVPEAIVRKAYKAFLGAYKGVMKTLGWRDADVFEVINDVVTGAGFRAPVLEAKDLKKVGLSLPKLDHGR